MKAMLGYFCTSPKVHSTLRMSPAMEAGGTDQPWEMADLVAVEGTGEALKNRGRYKKRLAA
jgi:hypothetical protein